MEISGSFHGISVAHCNQNTFSPLANFVGFSLDFVDPLKMAD